MNVDLSRALRLLHQEPLNKRQPINHIQSQAPTPSHGSLTGDVVELMKQIAHAADLGIDSVALSRVPLKGENITNIHTMIHRVFNRAGEGSHITHSQIKALSAQRMDNVSCIADEGDSR